MTSVSIDRTTRDFQIRLNSLGFLHEYGKPLLAVDGLKGRNTRQAIELALKHFNEANPEDLFDPNGINRIHWHWTGGSYEVTHSTLSHYNDVHTFDGDSHDGAPALQQVYYQPGRVGVSHTRMANTGAIGQAVACMHGATENGRKVDAGKYPITWDGIDAMLERSAEYCKMFDIRVSPWTTITHAEVQTNIGIRQRGKWDIRVLPDDLTTLLGVREAGNILRKRLQCLLK